MEDLTSEKNSKNSLKQWVSKIKRYELELPRLYEKLEYLKVRSIGYNSPSFEPRLSSGGSSNYKGIDYWLEKIDECKRKIELYEKELNKFNSFVSDLLPIEKEVFIKRYYESYPPKTIINEIKIKRSKFYEISNKLNKVYFYKI